VTLIDLTHPFGEGIYNLRGCPPLKLHRFATIAKDGLNDTEASFGVHTGTHIDAPNHVFDDRRGMDQVTLDELCGPAVGWSVDLGPGDVIGVDLLEQQSPELERGDRVFIHTGWGRLFATREHERYRVHPYLSDEAAYWLVDRGARMLATDTPTPDLPGPLRTQGLASAPHPNAQRRANRRERGQSGQGSRQTVPRLRAAAADRWVGRVPSAHRRGAAAVTPAAKRDALRKPRAPATRN
jgi:kynurenine formamidase